MYTVLINNRKNSLSFLFIKYIKVHKNFGVYSRLPHDSLVGHFVFKIEPVYSNFTFYLEQMRAFGLILFLKVPGPAPPFVQSPGAIEYTDCFSAEE